MRRLWIAGILIASIFGLVPSNAAVQGGAPENNVKYAYFYQFSDQSINTPRFQNPIDAIRVSLPKLNSISLIMWNLISQQLPVPKEPYDRKKHFGDWIVDPRNGNCLNTRGVVLVRDSLSPVATDPFNRCLIAKGNWFDPYSHSSFKVSGDVQIDHVVPLKHAYISGGFKWDARVKCLYTNYRGFRDHLLVVKGSENMKKSDATPYSYMPPNREFACAYLINWLKIKKIWNLDLIPPETQAISKAFKDNNCDAKSFEMSLQELYQQRKYINDNYRLCDMVGKQ